MNFFFDVDGVVVEGWHTNPKYRRPWTKSLESDLGVNVQAFQEAFFQKLESHGESYMTLCTQGKLDIENALAKVLPDLGYVGEVKDFLNYWLQKDSQISKPVLSLVARLRRSPGVRIYLATGQEHRRANYLWSDLGLRNHFDSMFYSADIGYSKTDPRFYASINKRLALGSGAPITFIDDSPKAISAASEAGWSGVQFDTISDIERCPAVTALLNCDA